MNACACMGIKEGDEYCYCELKARGLPTDKHEWSQESKDKLKEFLQKVFEKNRIENG